MAQRSRTRKPSMQPSDEASRETLDLARNQGDAMGKALKYMTDEEADDGGEQHAGDFLVGYAVEKAEGLYHMRDGQLRWEEPTEENVHIEVSVRDAGDGRFIPGLTVHATLVDPDGNEVGTHTQPFLWHPWLYHYGRNWKVPGDGAYTLRVRVDAPSFPRHDKVNGDRYADPVEVEFRGVRIRTGRKQS